MMQPPARGPTPTPLARCFIIQHEERKDGRTACSRGPQRGIVSQTQILPEPDDDGAHALTTHGACFWIISWQGSLFGKPGAFLMAKAGRQMVIDHADGLGEGVRDHRPAEIEAALFE